MYEERREKFSFKSFFLTLLLIILFIFLMLWLFPTKWEVNKLQSTYDIDRLSVLYDEIFANNITRMKDAAIGYFTNERMPEKVGESKKLTLREMYELHLILEIKGKDGNSCNVDRSYVEMTKYDDEYRLKVNLSCGEQEDYIIVYLGCYDYCDGICEKRVETSKKEDKKPSKEEDKKPSKEEDKKPSKEDDKKPSKEDDKEPPKDEEVVTPVVKKYMYEYVLVIPEKTTCADWSSWDKKELIASDTVKVETKKEKEIIDYKVNKVQTGTKKETVVVGQKTEKFIADYLTELVVVDTKLEQSGTTTKKVKEEVKVGTVEVYVGIDSGSVVPKPVDGKVYKNVTVDTSDSCSYCENEVGYTWEVWEIKPVYDVVERTVTIPVYKKVNVYKEVTTPVYDFKVVDVTEVKETPVYKEVKEPVYGDVTYYRQQTCTVTKGSTSKEWSSSQNDSNLLNKEYKLTGNVKEV